MAARLCIDWGQENNTTSLNLVSKVIYCLLDISSEMCCFNHKGWCLTRSHEHFLSVYLLGLLSDLQAEFSTSSAGIFSHSELLCAGDQNTDMSSQHISPVYCGIFPDLLELELFVLCIEKQCKSIYNVRDN